MVISMVSAPTNLGLRPPPRGGVPGTAGAPEALRRAGLFRRFTELGAIDVGSVLPGRYVDDDRVRPPGRVRNQNMMIEHARRLGVRLSSIIAAGDTPMVVGGDCSLLLAAGLAMKSIGGGLVHVDGHTDFRHPGNSDACASVAGEDLAAAVGSHWPAIADIDGRGPYFPPRRVAHIGCRTEDEHLREARSRLGLVVTAGEARARGVRAAGAAARATARRSIAASGGAESRNIESGSAVSETIGSSTMGYWLQVDVDVLDPVWMPAVDSPDPGGFTPDELVALLVELAPGAVGASVTVFDPDLDPDGRYARVLVDVLTAGLSRLGSERGGTHGG